MIRFPFLPFAAGAVAAAAALFLFPARRDAPGVPAMAVAPRPHPVKVQTEREPLPRWETPATISGEGPLVLRLARMMRAPETYDTGPTCPPAFMSLVEALPPAELAAACAEAEALSLDETGKKVRSILLSQWAALDPDRAFLFAKDSMKEQGSQAEVFKDVCHFHPVRALGLFRQGAGALPSQIVYGGSPLPPGGLGGNVGIFFAAESRQPRSAEWRESVGGFARRLEQAAQAVAQAPENEREAATAEGRAALTGCLSQTRRACPSAEVAVAAGVLFLRLHLTLYERMSAYPGFLNWVDAAWALDKGGMVAALRSIPNPEERERVMHFFADTLDCRNINSMRDMHATLLPGKPRKMQPGF